MYVALREVTWLYGVHTELVPRRQQFHVAPAPAMPAL